MRLAGRVRGWFVQVLVGGRDVGFAQCWSRQRTRLAVSITVGCGRLLGEESPGQGRDVWSQGKKGLKGGIEWDSCRAKSTKSAKPTKSTKSTKSTKTTKSSKSGDSGRKWLSSRKQGR